MRTVKKPRVGIVGEILVKFSPLANNHLVELLESEGAEAVMPDLMDFLLYCFYNSNFKARQPGRRSAPPPISATWESRSLEYFRKTARDSSGKEPSLYAAQRKIADLADMANDFVSLGNQTGEGWFLTGEMLELIHGGTAEHRLRPALRLPAEPHRRQGRYQGTAAAVPERQHHRRGL